VKTLARCTLRIDHRLMVSVFVLLLVTVTVGTLSRPVIDVPLHGPDAHSAMPHQDAQPGLRAEARSVLAAAVLVGGDQHDWVAAEPSFSPGRLTTGPLDQPPR
jgi:hypothetical protein